ncbi:MAG TPA: PD-(D/E)XK nuclease-like domain-containing protein [Bacteroidales bacterium]|nr:PD-(D/E)XK nuclease-like domain-containing protein [Bacteroidales bacterium]
MHNNKTYDTTVAISNSSLNLYQQSPRKFIKYYNGEREESDNYFFIYGSAIHCYILEQEEFKKRYKFYDFILPNSPNKKQFINTYVNSKKKETDKLIEAYKASYVTNSSDEDILKKAKALKEEFKSYFKYLKYTEKGIICLPKNMETLFKSIKKELTNNEKANELLFTEELDFKNIYIYNELPVYWDMKKEDRKYPMKALIDRLMVDKDKKIIKIIDLKTTKNINKFKDSFFEFNYDRQLAFYSLAASEFVKKTFPEENIDNYEIEFYIVAVDKNTEPESKVYFVKYETIFKALEEIISLLNDIHWHFTHNKWEYTVEQYENGYETI